MTEDEKYKVISRLQLSEEPKDIAEQLNVSYASVLRLRREFNEAVTANTVDQLVDTDKLLLTSVAKELEVSHDSVQSLTRGLEGLELLNTKLQTTAVSINQKVASLIHSVDSLSELETASEIICKLQTAFLNKNLTQVNVQNNFSEDSSKPKYAQYLSDTPVD